MRRLALAHMLSVTGSGAAAIALSAEVYRLTNSAVWLSATFFLTFGIAGLLHPVAGSIADRFDRQRVMVTSDVVAAGVWIVLIWADAPPALLSLGFVGAVASAPFRLASQAAIPNIVGPDELNRANGLLAVAKNIGRIGGPVIGGALFAWVGPDVAFGANATSFALSAVLVASIRATFGEREPSQHGEKTRPLEGFVRLWADPATRSLFVVWVLLYLTVDVAVVADLPIAVEFGWGTFGYGLIETAIGAGALIGSVFARRISRRLEPWAVLTGALGIGAGYLVVAAAPIFAFVLAGNFIWALLDAGDEVAGTSIFQRRTPDEVRARVFGAVGMGGLMANAVGFTFAGFLVEAFGPKGTYAICGVASLLATPLLAPMFRALRSEGEVEKRLGSQ